MYEQYEVHYVLNCPTQIHEDMQGKTSWIVHAERNWKVLINVIEAWKICRLQRPTLILSAGAGCIVPFSLVAKVIGIPVIYVESFTNVTSPSLTGRIMYYLADRFIVQWQELQKVFPNSIYGGHVS